MMADRRLGNKTQKTAAHSLVLVCRLHIAFPSFLVAHLPAGHSHAPRWKCKEYTKYMWEDSEKYCDLKYTSRSRSASPV